MLSILIPIYNQPCLSLVKNLAKQASDANIPFEIICIDDHSPQVFDENKFIVNIANCCYMELKENIGRSKIRNLLAQKSQYEYLLFLDCDSEIVYSDYIKTYLKYMAESKVISGGRIYQENEPQNIEYLLHWKYGTVREPKPTDKQNQVFMSNNFVIHKNIFEINPFDESITKYGHEDSLFQIDLYKKGHNILFINNPIKHAGLETSSDFMRKVRVSTENIWELYKNGGLNERNSTSLKLLNTYIRLKKLGLDQLFSYTYAIGKRIFEKNLFSRHPFLLILDIYKLCYLSHIARRS